MQVTFGKFICFKMLKCLLLVTIKSALDLIAQSTYLLSSGSAVIRFQL